MSDGMSAFLRTLLVLTVLGIVIFGVVLWVQWGNATQMRPGIVEAKHEGRWNPAGQSTPFGVLVHPRDSLFTWWCPATAEEYASATIGHMYGTESR